MAKDKKSFILYTDVCYMAKHLTDEQAGKLFKHLLAYVNDENPETEDQIINLAFEPIKQSLKRDLLKYETKREERSKAGKLGNLKKYHLDLYEKVISEDLSLEDALIIAKSRIATQSETNTAVNGSVNVNDSVIYTPISPEGESHSDSNKNPKPENQTEYTQQDFFKDWNELRTEHLKTPSFLNAITGAENKQNFRDLLKSYDREMIRDALTGLFKQKSMPRGNKSMQSNPAHFLKYFPTYHQAYHDKNSNVYGKPEEVNG